MTLAEAQSSDYKGFQFTMTEIAREDLNEFIFLFFILVDKQLEYNKDYNLIKFANRRFDIFMHNETIERLIEKKFIIKKPSGVFSFYYETELGKKWYLESYPDYLREIYRVFPKQEEYIEALNYRIII